MLHIKLGSWKEIIDCDAECVCVYVCVREREDVGLVKKKGIVKVRVQGYKCQQI